MLNSKVAELTDGLIQTQFTERRQLLQEEFLRVAQELNGRGNYTPLRTFYVSLKYVVVRWKFARGLSITRI